MNHIAGNLFQERGVEIGDVIYVVTVIKGTLYVCGKLIVGQLCGVGEAADTLGCDPTDLWEADEHIIAIAATPMNFNLRIPTSLTNQLKFISGSGTKPLVFKTHNYLDQQTLRGVRELEPASAAKLDELLPPMKKFHKAENTNESVAIFDEMLPEEIDSATSYYEGAAKQIIVNVYERNPQARKICIKYYGLDCFICGFNFKSAYGDTGDGFIHVHHLKPLSEIGKESELDAINDLRPVCPNCHAMIHRKIPAYTIEEVKSLYRKGN